LQVGEESRQAVLDLNSLVRQKVDLQSEGALRQGVRSLLQDYEGEITGMLRHSLPSVTQYVESRAVDFLVSHNLSRVLLDLEGVRVALHLPADCSEEAQLRLAVQLANSSVAAQKFGSRRQQLQQQLADEQQQLAMLARQFTAVQAASGTISSSLSVGQPRSTAITCETEGSIAPGSKQSIDSSSSSSSGSSASSSDNKDSSSGGSSSSDGNDLAQQLLEVQERVAALQEQLHGEPGWC
jgi:paraquat-inducible protein B